MATAGSGAVIPADGSGVFDFAGNGWTLVTAGQAFTRAANPASTASTIGPTDTLSLAGQNNVTHVALGSVTHFGVGTYGNFVGLSELQIVHQTTDPQIEGVTAWASSQFSTLGGANAVDGSGLTGDQHDAGGGNNWLAALNTGSSGNEWFVADLGGTYTLEEMVLWNYNEFASGYPGLTSRGVSSADIYVAYEYGGAVIPGDLGGAFDFLANGWTLVEDDHLFTRATEPASIADTTGPTDVVSLLGTGTVTHIALADLMNFAPDTFGNNIGFAEVAFTGAAVPEPSSLVMCVFGLLGLAWYGWRRRK